MEFKVGDIIYDKITYKEYIIFNLKLNNTIGILAYNNKVKFLSVPIHELIYAKSDQYFTKQEYLIFIREEKLKIILEHARI